MKHTARFAKLTSTLILLALLPVTNALAQEERGIIIVDNIPVGLISPNTLTITYIPLADIGTALGSAVKYDAGRNRYTVQPSEGGILKLNPEHAGIIIDDRPAPAAEGQRVSPTARVMRRPQQRVEQPAVPETMSFAIGDKLVSKGIVVVDNRPYMPLDDLAAAMGTIIENRPSPEGGGTVPVLVPQQGVTPLLGLSERGIIIVETKEQ
jgi:hypothetical protein